jgi:YegS/Rv2252/BmrU family lipid kinase
MHRDRLHTVVVNPASGGGRGARLIKRLPRFFAQLDLKAEYRLSRTDVHFKELVGRISREAGRRLIVCGGDGSLNMALSALSPGSRAVIGLLPCGRGNDLARSLGIPRNPKDAAALLLSGEERTVDIGYVGDRPFASIAGAGFDALVSIAASKSKLIKGKLVYLVSAVKELSKYRASRFRIESQGFSFDGEAMMVSFANAPYYGGGMKLSPDSKLDDGMLDVCIVLPMSKARFVRKLLSVFKGGHTGSPDFVTAPVQRAKIDAAEPLPICADGEHLGSIPAQISVRSGAVTVICGKGALPSSSGGSGR